MTTMAVATAVEAGGEPIKVGASLPLTGEFSEPGKAAKQGYKVWEAMVNEQGGLIDGRQVKMVIKDDQTNQNTIVADYNALISQDKVDLLLGTFSSLLNLPASAVAERNRMLYVEPAGGAPELFERGFKFLFFAQQATADKQGEVWANYITELPEDQRPKTAAYPTLDDPFAQPDLRGDRGDLQQGRDQDGLPRDLHDRQPEPRRHRQRDQVEEPGRGRPRCDLRGRGRHGARAAQGGLHAEDALPDDGAVAGRPVLQGDRQGRRPRASSTR